MITRLKLAAGFHGALCGMYFCLVGQQKMADTPSLHSILLLSDDVDYELVKWFLDHGADPNADCRGKEKVTNFM